jgi:hypothetical protein
MSLVNGTAPLLRAVRRRLAGLAARHPDREKTFACIESFDSLPWASATFEGHRHMFAIRVSGRPDLVDVIAGGCREMAAEEFALPGELLADMECVGDACVSDGVLAARTLSFEALTLRD